MVAVNPVLAPRVTQCWVCKSVATIEDVTLRMFNDAGETIDPKLANPQVRDYMTAIGHSASPQTWVKRIASHRKHVENYLWSRVDEVAPMKMDPLVTVVRGPSTFVDLNQTGMDVGMDALRAVQARLDRGTEQHLTREGEIVELDIPIMALTAVAKLGQTAANKRGDWTSKGRLRQEGEAQARLASGLDS